MVTVTAPVADFTGEVAGVSFKDGTAATADPVAIGYFRRAGYKLGAAPVDDVPPASPTGAPDPSASKATWVAYAVSRGAIEARAKKMTRAVLIAAFSPGEELVDPGQRSPEIGADVLVGQEVPDPEEVAGRPLAAATLGEDLDDDGEILRHGEGR